MSKWIKEIRVDKFILTMYYQKLLQMGVSVSATKNRSNISSA